MKNIILWPVVLIFVFALSRWLGLIPYFEWPHNFSAAYALMFCAGLYLPRRLAWVVPLGVMLVTDLILSFLYYNSDSYSLLHFLKDQLPNYTAYAVLIELGVSAGRETVVGDAGQRRHFWRDSVLFDHQYGFMDDNGAISEDFGRMDPGADDRAAGSTRRSGNFSRDAVERGNFQLRYLSGR